MRNLTRGARHCVYIRWGKRRMAEDNLRSEPRSGIDRRRLLTYTAAGTVVAALGGYLFSVTGPEDEETAKAAAELRPDGRRRVPPRQRVIRRLKPMGGAEGDP